MTTQTSWSRKDEIELLRDKVRAFDALLKAAKLALPGLVHLEAETSFAGIRADAQMAANTLRAAIAEAEKP